MPESFFETKKSASPIVKMLLRKRAIGSFLLCLLLLLVPALFLFGVQTSLNPLIWLVDRALSSKGPMQTESPPTTHIILFKFKESATPFQIKDITSRMLSLGRQCIHPSTRTPYIKSITGGRDNSIENLQEGVSHAFIVQFYSNEDRDYYVNEDPVHQTFKDAAGAYLERTVVVDFQEGVFTYMDA